MTIEEKVLDFYTCDGRKKAYTANQIAKHYIVNEKSVQRALKALTEKGELIAVPKTKPLQYRLA
jgi:Fic family protein